MNWDVVVAPKLTAGSMVIKAIATMVVPRDAVRMDFKSDLNMLFKLIKLAPIADFVKD